MSRKLFFTAEESGVRIDSYIPRICGEITRSAVKNLIEKGDVLLNGKTVKAKEKVSAGDEIAVIIPDVCEVAIVPQDIPIDIVYEDEDIAVINKAQGMVVHPAAGNPDGTLVNAIMFRIKDLSGINGELRPGIVHRIDKDTSGLLVIAKNDEAHRSLSEQIKEKTAKRIYEAVVFGNIKQDSGTVDKPIARSKKDRKIMAIDMGGRNAVTHYKVLERFGEYTYIRCELETGRTHQIRVHMKYLGHPIVGDRVYTKRKDEFGLSGQLLHAKKLCLIHPRTKKHMEFECELPDYFKNVLEKLERKYGAKNC